MINYSETHYNWFKISVLGGILLSLFIFSLFVWGFNPLAKKEGSKNETGEISSISPTPALSPTPGVSLIPTTLISGSANRDIFAKPNSSGVTHDLTLPSPTPIITLPYSSACPTEATLFDKSGQPQGCLVRPGF